MPACGLQCSRARCSRCMEPGQTSCIRVAAGRCAAAGGARAGGLALRLDAFERSAAKRHADKSWMRAAAEDLGASSHNQAGECTGNTQSYQVAEGRVAERQQKDLGIGAAGLAVANLAS